MKSLYKAVGIGMLSLSLMLSSCRKKETEQAPQEPNTQQVQVQVSQTDIPLENRLEIILNNLFSRLSESELPIKDYCNLVFEQLKSQEILSGNYHNNSYNVRCMGVLFSKKLSTKRMVGLTQDYVMLESIPISDKTQEDIATYKRFKTEVGEYLKQKIGKEPISKDYFEKTIHNYVFSNLPNNFENKYRREGIKGNLIATYRGKFNTLTP